MSSLDLMCDSERVITWIMAIVIVLSITLALGAALKWFGCVDV